MRVLRLSGLVAVHATKADTREWSRRWPCSALSGRDVQVTLAPNGDLLDLTVSGRGEVPGDELTAFVESALAGA